MLWNDINLVHLHLKILEAKCFCTHYVDLDLSNVLVILVGKLVLVTRSTSWRVGEIKNSLYAKNSIIILPHVWIVGVVSFSKVDRILPIVELNCMN